MTVSPLPAETLHCGWTTIIEWEIGMGRTYNLTPGVLDGSAENAFTQGACGALAIAIHDATGWPIVSITDAHNVYDGDAGGGSALHWAVRHPPTGLILDVYGLHDDQTMIERYEGEADDGEAAIGRSTKADVEEWYVEAQGAPVPIPLAATFVDVVIERAMQRHDAQPRATPTP
jgi:hypothetical protein